MNQPLPIKKLFKIALLTSPLISLLALLTIHYFLMSSPVSAKVGFFLKLINFLHSLIKVSIVVFIFWSINIFIIYLINKFKVKVFPNLFVYIISYLFLIIIILIIRYNVIAYYKLKLGDNYSYYDELNQFLVVILFILLNINTIILIMRIKG